MAEAVALGAQKREKLGTAESRRLRQSGLVPGNVYGHKEDAVPILVAEEVLSAIIYEGHKVIDLSLDGQVQTTIFREVQFDTYGQQILHFDLLRVDPNERVWTEVPIELRGISPGVVAGGVLEHHLHSLAMEVKTLELPDVIRVRITDLKVGDVIHLKDLELPPSAKVELPEDTVVVQVNQPGVAVEEEPSEGGPLQPELVGKEGAAEEG